MIFFLFSFYIYSYIFQKFYVVTLLNISLVLFICIILSSEHINSQVITIRNLIYAFPYLCSFHHHSSLVDLFISSQENYVKRTVSSFHFLSEIFNSKAKLNIKKETTAERLKFSTAGSNSSVEICEGYKEKQ